MKRIIALLLALLMVFALFAGCGKKEEAKDSGKNDSGTSSPSNTGSSTDTGKGKELETSGPVETTIGVTRYPATEGKNNYTKTEGVLLTELDKTKVHPSDTAVFKFATNAMPTTLCMLHGENGAVSFGMFYDTLVFYNEQTGEFTPGLATEWEWTDDYTIRFKLREDVKSHMGDPFTASDVIFSLAWGCESTKLASNYSSIFDMEKCKVVDKYTVDLVTKDPMPFLLYTLSSNVYYPIVVEASVEKLGGKDEAAMKPLMGTGPYKFDSIDTVAQNWTAVRNEDYWAALPYYARMEVYVVPDNTTRGMGLEAGDYDGIQSATSNSVIAAFDNPDITTYCVSSGTSATLLWNLNTDREPLNNVNVRRAIALAINYEAVAQVAYNGYADPCDGMIPYSADWHAPVADENDFYYKYDPDRAKELLVEAGYPDGVEFAIMYEGSRADVNAAVEVMNNGLEKVGIKLKLEQYDSATLMDLRNAGEYDSALGLSMNSNPTATLKNVDPRYRHLSLSTWVDSEPNKDEIYDLFDKCLYTADYDKCVEYIGEMQGILRSLVPNIVVATPRNFHMYDGKIVNVTFDANGAVILSQLFEEEYLTGK